MEKKFYVVMLVTVIATSLLATSCQKEENSLISTSNQKTWKSNLHAYVTDFAPSQSNSAEGVSRSIYAALQAYFDEYGKDGSYEQAKDYVASKVKGWNLSAEDFKEAKKMLLKESVNEADEKKEEKKDEKDDKEEKADAWKTEFSDFLKSDARHLEKKAKLNLKTLLYPKLKSTGGSLRDPIEGIPFFSLGMVSQ